MAVRKIQTKRRCICYTRKASKNEENLRTQAHDVESVRITRLDDGEKLRKREYSRELLSIYGEGIRMAKYYYPAIFERDEEAKTYTVTFPDLQGCITQGENLEDASEMAKEAVGVYFDGIREKDFPAPVDVENLTMKKNQVLMLVEFDKTAYDRKYNSKAVKKTLTIPQWLNDLAVDSKINFSKVLQKALMKECNVK